jgi:hypothetical protein
VIVNPLRSPQVPPNHYDLTSNACRSIQSPIPQACPSVLRHRTARSLPQTKTTKRPNALSIEATSLRIQQVRIDSALLLATWLSLTACGGTPTGVTPMPTPDLATSHLWADTRFDPSDICDLWNPCSGQREALTAGAQHLQAIIDGRDEDAQAGLSEFLRTAVAKDRIAYDVQGEIALLRLCQNRRPVFDGWNRLRDSGARTYFLYPYSYIVRVIYTPACGATPTGNTGGIRGLAACLTGVSDESRHLLGIRVGGAWRSGWLLCV